MSSDFAPTVNLTIDPHPEAQTPPPSPRTPLLSAPPPAPDAHELIAVSFAIGVVIGGMLVFAFSRSSAVDA